MVTLVSSQLDAIRQLCQKYQVERLEFFGSAALGDFSFQSDVDFLVRFATDECLYDRYFGLSEELETLLGRKVDLVMEGALKNPYFIDSINTSRKVLYAF